MTQAECRFKNGPVGRVTADRLSDAEATYAFMPARSKSHLDLAQALTQAGRATVVVEWEGRRVTMTATAMTARSITLRPA